MRSTVQEYINQQETRLGRLENIVHSLQEYYRSLQERLQSNEAESVRQILATLSDTQVELANEIAALKGSLQRLKTETAENTSV
jgi:hypothetical protein